MDYYRSNLERIKDMLQNPETIITSTTATVAANFSGVQTAKIGALALTNQRLIFSGGGKFFGFTQESIDLSTVTSVNLTTEHVAGLIIPVRGTLLTVAQAGKDSLFTLESSSAGQEFVSELNKFVGRGKAQTTISSMTAELQGLISMFESGHLTEEEFNLAKSKLLNN